MKTFVSLFIISLIVVVFVFLQDKNDNLQIEEEVTKKIVEVEKITNKKFSRKLKLRGFTQASRVVTLKSQVEGKVSSKNFIKGIDYKAGTQLILIDPEDKVAKLKEMEALLNQRKKEYQVAENLFEKGFRSEVKLTESRTNSSIFIFLSSNR